MNRPMPRRSSTSRIGRRRGFTLIELLVVLLIVMIVSAITIPAIVGSMATSEVNEAARILQAALAGARDSSLHDQSGLPHGVRFLADPVLTQPSQTTVTGTTAALAGSTTLAFNRMLPIETAPDYAQGMAAQSAAIPKYTGGQAVASLTVSAVAPYIKFLDNGAAAPDPFPGGHVLQEPAAVYIDPVSGNPTLVPYEQTNWFWNVKSGDQVQIGGSGKWYTIVGPLVINPMDSNGANPELFINDGPPGSSLITKTYYDTMGGNLGTLNVEYLFVTDGIDNDGDGFVDNGWDGYDNNGDGLVDDFKEWEIETSPIVRNTIFLSSLSGNVPPNYKIRRRNPIASPGGRETLLPQNVVIDATTAVSSAISGTPPERSRLPIDQFTASTLYFDILLDRGGRVVPTTRYSSPTSFQMGESFYHFWLTQRQGVSEPIFGVSSTTALPNANCNAAKGFAFVLPMPKGTTGFFDNCSGAPTTRFLQGERRLLTLYTRSGNIVVNDITSETNFDPTNVSAPFYKAQQGLSDTR